MWNKCEFFSAASAVASLMRMENAISHDFKRFFIFARVFFCISPPSRKSFSFIYFSFLQRFREKNIVKTQKLFFLFSPFSCTFFPVEKKKRKLLAVLQKFTNNTQSEASSMAFTNFHSCLKNSLSLLFFCFLFAACEKEPENEKARNYE